MHPIMISHHSTTRCSMRKTRSPFFAPRPVSALAARVDRSDNSRNVISRDVLPSGASQTIATFSGSSPQRSKTS